MTSTRTPLSKDGNIEPWLIAKENFLKGMSRAEQKAFSSTRQETVQQDIEKLRKDTDSRTRKCMVKCTPFFDGVRSLDAVISPIAGLEPHGIGALVWGSVKICLNLVQGYVEVFGKVEDFLAGVGDQLGQLEVYKDLYKSTTPTRFSNSLVRVFEKYLAFFRQVKEFLEASKLRHVKDALGLSSQEHNRQALVSLSMELVQAECGNAKEEAKVAEAQARAKASQADVDAHERIEQGIEVVRAAVERGHHDAEQRRRKEIFDSYLQWLKPVIGSVDSRRDELLTPKKEAEDESGVSTGSWIFADERFKNWIKPSEASDHILWLTGEPGFGKSTLTAYVTAEMQKWQPTGVAYFFCTYRYDDTRSVDAILRTWIWQLLSKPKHFSRPFPGHLALPEDEYEFTRPPNPNFEDMCDLMRQLYQQTKPPKPTTLIVDGLDECPEPLERTPERNRWLAFFGLLRDAPKEWKILLVSRPRTWFRNDLIANCDQGRLERVIEHKDNGVDIENFATHELQSLAPKNGWDEQLTRDAYRVIVNNADGMFLYVGLFCQELRNKKGRAVPAALEHPPKGLQGFYDRTMEGVHNQDEDIQNDLLATLRWILCASRSFKVEELADALELTPKVKDELHLLLGSFIRIDSRTKEISLVHASAKEYLLSVDTQLVNTADGSDQAKLVPIHAEILERCLEYITKPGRDFVLVDADRSASERRMRDALKQEPFLEYAAVHWVQHFIEVSKMQQRLESSQHFLDKLFLSDTAILQWLQVFHFLFQFNFSGSNTSRSLIGGLVFHPPKENTWQMFMHNHYRSFVDHLGWSDGGRFTRWDRFMHVRHEFNHYDPVGRWEQSPTCLSGLLLAAFFDYTEALKEMSNGGEDKDKRSSLDSTPLLWAATADSCTALQWLIDVGANIETPYRHTGETPIYRAVRVPHSVNRRPGRYPAALLLHQKGARLNVFPDDNGWLAQTVLITLIEECPDSPGSAELVRAIVNDDPARFRDYVRRGSVLQTAAWFSRPLILEALLKDGHIKTRINAQVRKSAPMHDACAGNDPKTVQTLLDHGADVNIRSHLNSFTPLHSAILSGGGTIATLLDAGANPDLGAFFNNTAVHLAAENDARINFKLFVDKGFKIDRPNDQGRTPLAVAIEHSNYTVASQLLDLGADPGKVPPHLHQQYPSNMADKRLEALRRKHWRPCWSFELCWRLQRAKMDDSLFSEGTFSDCPPSVRESQRALKTFPVLPIPIVARILARAGLYETLSARRDGLVIVNEAITIHGGDNQPYVMSRPLFGAASAPIRHLDMAVFGRCQSFGGEHAYSFYEAKTVEGSSKRCVKWQPEVIFGHNGRPWQEKKRVFSDQRQEDKVYLDRIKAGDRVAIVQRAHYPGWENQTQWASVKVDIAVLRDKFTNAEKDRIWPHNRGKNGWCVLGRCPRCAIDRRTGKKKG